LWKAGRSGSFSEEIKKRKIAVMEAEKVTRYK
jgi:hypothetical protein